MAHFIDLHTATGVITINLDQARSITFWPDGTAKLWLSQHLEYVIKPESIPALRAAIAAQQAPLKI